MTCLSFVVKFIDEFFILQFKMDSNTKVASFITEVKPNSSEISKSTLNKEESLPKNVRGVKGLARKFPTMLATFTSQSDNSPDSIEKAKHNQ